MLAQVHSFLSKEAKRRILGEVKRNLVESRRLELQRQVEAGLGAVFGLEAPLDDFELEDADGGELSRSGRVVEMLSFLFG